jgi:hypothetical protein
MDSTALYTSPYHPHLADALERRRAFYRRQAPGSVLSIYSVAGRARHNHLGAIPDYRQMCAANVARFEARSDLDDDWVPLAQTHLGMGLFGAIYGSQMIWMPENETSWSDPPLAEWPDDLPERLRFDPDNPLIDLARRTIRYYREQAQGRFGVGVLETIDALNLVVALRGATNAYTDIYLHPDEVRTVMERGLQWNIKWLEMQWNEAGPYAGGWCTLIDWLPEKTVWLSVDADSYCKIETYAQLSRPYMQRLIDHFGAGWQHLHAPGVRLLPEIVKLRNLVAIQIGDDVGYPRAFSRLREVQKITGGIPLQVGCTWDEFRAAFQDGTLPGNVEYHVSGAPSASAANEAAKAARRYRDRHAPGGDGAGVS